MSLFITRARLFLFTGLTPSLTRLQPRPRRITHQILYEVSNMFRHDIPGAQFGRLVFHDVGQDLACRTQRLENHIIGPAPQEGADPTKDTAEKIADFMPSL